MNKRIFPILLLLIYCYFLIQILVFKDLALIRVGPMRFNFGGTQEGPANLIPFKTILYYLLGNNGLLIGGINILGNIVALVPFGFLYSFVFTKISWRNRLILSLIAGSVIEGSQVLLHVGIFDIDDVLLNGLGVLIGFWKFDLFHTFSKRTRVIISGLVFSILCILLILCTLAYYKVLQFPIGIEPSIERAALPKLPTMQNGSTNCCDLCGGTGGTGVIISIGNNTMAIKRRDGVIQNIKLTNHTIIKNSKGALNATLLKTNDHVTVVIDDTETASLVLVCGIQ